jgi:hypothetical protein
VASVRKGQPGDAKYVLKLDSFQCTSMVMSRQLRLQVCCLLLPIACRSIGQSKLSSKDLPMDPSSTQRGSEWQRERAVWEVVAVSAVKGARPAVCIA